MMALVISHVLLLRGGRPTGAPETRHRFKKMNEKEITKAKQSKAKQNKMKKNKLNKLNK